jgi:hypothetical protein
VQDAKEAKTFCATNRRWDLASGWRVIFGSPPGDSDGDHDPTPILDHHAGDLDLLYR